MGHALATQLLGAALAPVEQEHLFEARQMQALSFAVHIPLVCFGIAFPSMVLLVESLYVRTGDEIYRTLAKRWSKVMIALFAVGVVTGTILSFEMGLLWPNFMATFGDVFGLAFGLEGFSFFIEAIFIAIYVYGWDRMSLACAPAVRHPRRARRPHRVAVRHLGQRLDEPPLGLPAGGRPRRRRRPLGRPVRQRHLWPELSHMYFAGFIVAGFLVAAVYAWGWLKGRRGRYERVALAVPLTIAALASPVQLLMGDWIARRVTDDQPIKLAALEGLGPTTKGAPLHFLGWYEDGEVKYGIEIPKLLSLLAKHDPNATIQGLESVPADDRPPPINLVRFAFQTMVADRHRCWPRSASYTCSSGSAAAASSSRAWFLWGVVAAGPLSRRSADLRLDNDRGGPPAVGRLRRHAHRGRGHGRGRHTGGLRDARDRLPRRSRRPSPGSCAAWRRSRSTCRTSRRRSWRRMELADVPALLILIGIAAYIVFAGADFGAGLWYLLAGPGPRGRPIRDFTYHAMAPVWEANHVWLIFVLVVTWTAYPTAFGSIMSTLSVPFFIAAVGIILRGTAYALRSGAAPDRETEGVTGLVFGASSILTPFALGTVIGGIAAARCRSATPRATCSRAGSTPHRSSSACSPWPPRATSPRSISRATRTRHGEKELARAFRTRALAMAVIAGALGVAGLIVLRADARELFDDLTERRRPRGRDRLRRGGLATVVLVRAGRYEPARASAALAVAAIVAGWGLAQRPELLPGLTVDEAAAGHATLVALLISIAAGLVILVPSLMLLYGLVLRGRFDEEAPAPAEQAPPRPHWALRPPVAVALVLLAIGSPLTFLGEGVTLAIGVLALVPFVVTGALALLQPELLGQAEPGRRG